MLRQRALEVAPDLGTAHALVRDVLEHHDLALLSERRERGRKLGADEAPADQHDALRRGRLLAQGIGVADRAQVVDPVQVRSVDPQDPHVRPGRKERLLEAHQVLVGELRDAGVDVQRHHSGAGQQLDALLGVPVVGPEQHVLARFLPAQVLLGQRRPVVGRIGLAAHQEDVALGPLLAQVARAVAGCDAAADQQELDRALRHARGSC